MQGENKKSDSNGNYTKYAWAAFLGIVIFVIIYKYTVGEIDGTELSDLQEHTMHAENIYLDRMWNAWLKRPYLFWHLCVKSCIKFLSLHLFSGLYFINPYQYII